MLRHEPEAVVEPVREADAERDERVFEQHEKATNLLGQAGQSNLDSGAHEHDGSAQQDSPATTDPVTDSNDEQNSKKRSTS